MDPHEFVTRWRALLPVDQRYDFMMQLALLITMEQARERRRLTTDRRLYEQAVKETEDEIRLLRQVPR